MSTTTAVSRPEPWPVWAKILLIAIALLAVATLLPWFAMWTSMATTCVPMMGDMNRMLEMMRPGMTR